MADTPDYPGLLHQIDEWQRRAREAHPGVIPCRPGCSACCLGPFDISAADALMVRDAARALPPPQREALLVRAREQMARMEAFTGALPPPHDLSGLDDDIVDSVGDRMEKDPCPALDEAGCCVIYASRPMVCRLMGLGLVTPAGEVMPNACPIQDDFPAYRRLPPEPCSVELWGDAEALAEAQASVVLFGTPNRADFETTVAGAILLAAG